MVIVDRIKILTVFVLSGLMLTTCKKDTPTPSSDAYVAYLFGKSNYVGSTEINSTNLAYATLANGGTFYGYQNSSLATQQYGASLFATNMANNGDTITIFFHLNDYVPITTGTYNIQSGGINNVNSTFSGYAMAGYIYTTPKGNHAYNALSGSVKVTNIDYTKNKITGTFNFICPNTDDTTSILPLNPKDTVGIKSGIFNDVGIPTN